MKTTNLLIVVSLAALVAVANGKMSEVDVFYKNLAAHPSANKHAELVKYQENFRRMYSAFPSIELLKGVVDQMDDFAYGVGTSTITCGDAGQGKWISCLDELDTELVAIREKAAEITLTGIEKELSEYRWKALEFLAVYREYEKVATENEQKNFSVVVGSPMGIVGIPEANSLSCGIEFVYNGYQNIQSPFRVYDFFTDKSDKTSMSAGQLYDLLHSIGDDSAQQVPVESGLTREDYEAQMLKHSQDISALKEKISRYTPYCDPSVRWLNGYQLKWKFINEWEDYNYELFPGFKLSTYQAKILDQVIKIPPGMF